MIPGATARHRPIVHRTEPEPPEEHRDRGSFLTPRLYPCPPVDPWESDSEGEPAPEAPVVAKASM